MPSGPQWTSRPLPLPGRGETFIRESTGPIGAPALILLHGLGATGLLNWRSALDTLAREHRVVVVDHRGHGRGIQIRRPFRLADCADDVAAVADELGIPRFFAVGYSMGGPIAQLLWERHTSRIDGLVLCATACRFSDAERQRASFAVSPLLNAAGRVAPRGIIRNVARRVLSDSIADPKMRARLLSEVETSDPVSIGQAAAAIARFDSSTWIHQVDVPTAVVLTERDAMVPPHSQREMARRIPEAEVHAIQGEHDVCVSRPEIFVPALEQACQSVVLRSRQTRTR